MKKIGTVASLAIALAVTTTTAALAGEDAERVCLKCRTKTIVAAINGGAVDRVEDVIAPSAKLAYGATPTQDLAPAIDGWTAQGTRLELIEPRWDGEDTIVDATIEERSEVLERLGVGSVRWNARFEYDDDRLVLVTLSPDGEASSRVENATAAFLGWVRDTRPGELDSIADGPVLRKDREAVLTIARLLAARDSAGSGREGVPSTP